MAATKALAMDATPTAAENPLATAATPASTPDGATAAAPVQDRRLADILTRKAAGQKLSASDRGYLGSKTPRRRAAAAVVVPASQPATPLPPAMAPADNPLFAGAGEPDLAAPAPVAPVIDSGLLRDTADAILSSIDRLTKMFVSWQVGKAGADDETKAAYQKAVELQPEHRQLIVANSERPITKACEVFGCSPEKLSAVVKDSGFFGGLAAYATGVAMALNDIAKLREEKKKNEA